MIFVLYVRERMLMMLMKLVTSLLTGSSVQIALAQCGAMWTVWRNKQLAMCVLCVSLFSNSTIVSVVDIDIVIINGWSTKW